MVYVPQYLLKRRECGQRLTYIIGRVFSCADAAAALYKRCDIDRDLLTLTETV